MKTPIYRGFFCVFRIEQRLVIYIFSGQTLDLVLDCPYT